MFKADRTPSNFLKAVLHEFYLVHFLNTLSHMTFKGKENVKGARNFV